MLLVFNRLLPQVTPHLPQKILISHLRRSSVIFWKQTKDYGCPDARPDIMVENIMPPDLTVGGIKMNNIGIGG
jgi:hypothetical protein